MADQAAGDPVGDQALEAVNEAMVAVHERYHGRKPGTARTQMLGDDMIACLLGDVATESWAWPFPHQPGGTRTNPAA